MCGINGIFAFHPAASAPEEAELLKTREHMRARGPDGSGEWWSSDRRCAFGHRRLSIIDLSDRAAQPMASDDGRYVITFNGEIYNYPELRSELAARQVLFRTTSDTEVILQLYAREGPDMVSRLRGMFAFAIWDNARRRLFLARDPYGIKPLYTASDGWTFRFASQVKALLAGGKISREREPAGVVGFHLFGSVPEPFTFWRDIRALPAGHTQQVDELGAEPPRPFVNLAAILAEGARRPCDSERWLENAHAALTDSVRAHLVSDVEIGVFLSAGIDSGAILGLIADCGRTGVPALTLAFDEFRGMPEDEAPLAARVAELYGARHIVRRVSQKEFSDCLPEIFEAMDQPSIDGVNTWLVARAAKDAGLKVALSGLGGDELFAGYPSFSQVPRWHGRLGPLALVPGLGRITRALLHAIAPGLERSRPKALGMLQYAGTWQGAYLLRRALNLPEDVTRLEPDLVRDGLRRLRPLQLLETCIKPDPGSSVARVCALESGHYMRNQLLRDCDWAGMAHGVEIRLPLVDIVLLKSIAPFLPSLSPGEGKAALASAPSGKLPAEVVARGKTGFNVPTADWLPGTAPTEDGNFGRMHQGQASRRWSAIVLNQVTAETESLHPTRNPASTPAKPNGAAMKYRDKRTEILPLDAVQAGNRGWWTDHTMSYDRRGSIPSPRFTPAWFAEADARFLQASRMISGASNPFEEIMELGAVRGKRVLEIGCGMGLHSEMLARAGADLVSIDLSPTSVYATRQRFSQKGLPGEVRQMDAEKLEFPAASFDLVWSWGVIHHSSRTGRIVREIERVLRPGGTAKLMVYNLEGTPAYAVMATRYLTGFWRGHALDPLLWRSTDGFTARFYSRDIFADLLSAFFDSVNVSVLGQESDVLPVPRVLRKCACRLIPDTRKRAIVRRRGAFLFAVASK